MGGVGTVITHSQGQGNFFRLEIADPNDDKNNPACVYAYPNDQTGVYGVSYNLNFTPGEDGGPGTYSLGDQSGEFPRSGTLAGDGTMVKLPNQEDPVQIWKWNGNGANGKPGPLQNGMLPVYDATSALGGDDGDTVYFSPILGRNGWTSAVDFVSLSPDDPGTGF